MVSSLLLTIVFGAALGNVIRGVPLDAEGYFFLPLWTDFSPRPEPGVLDWYTVLCGLVALAALGTHGAHYLVLRTTGEVAARARRLARIGTRLLPLAHRRQPRCHVGGAARRARQLPGARRWVSSCPPPSSPASSSWSARSGAARSGPRSRPRARIWSAMLGGAAFALYPVFLPSSGDAARALTLAEAATSPYAMRVAMTWSIVAAIIVMVTFRYLYRSFRGKLTAGAEAGYGEH